MCECVSVSEVSVSEWSACVSLGRVKKIFVFPEAPPNRWAPSNSERFVWSDSIRVRQPREQPWRLLRVPLAVRTPPCFLD